ncbi:MAG TPA: ROK family transcriptional regulator [Stackebrandtia sp.]|uniref:ROK family transcriptional regulator n=1 Tax=Stackebrandtia sp. TaxID=2023065 RepID=UPI002D6CF61D|nr:ROK family transcriptional regulator [Stackebrandtia sp.]HZE40174.1 ROK family transcriptional regulator [Stackebrandtia sp.]
MKPNPASPQLARAINDRMALDLLVHHGRLSAPQLRDLTGLSRPSIADLLDRLQEGGLVTQVGESGKRRRGPNAKVYGLVTDYAHVAGVDVRSGAIHVALADLSGRVVATSRRSVGDEPALAALIRRALGDAARKAEVELGSLHTVVVGAPGFADQQTGELLPGYEYPGWDAALLPGLIDALDVPIAFENEADLAGIAELHTGAGLGRRDLAVMWLDRSVGASVILDGALRQGASGGAGEVGKLAVPGARLPVPGHGAGGLHSLVSAEAVRDLAAEYELPDAPVATQVRDACAADDTPAAHFVDALAARIALGTLALVAVVDPGLIVLAGDIGQAGGEELATMVSRHLTTLDVTPTEVRASELADPPVMTGAVLAALRIAHDDIFGGAGDLVAE